MISEQLQDQAALYALGCLPESDRAAFEAQLQKNAELRLLLASLSDSAFSVAGDCPHVKPACELKDRILSALDLKCKVVSFPGTQTSTLPPNGMWWISAIAACLAVFVIMSARESSLRTRIQDLSFLVNTLQSSTNDLRQTVAQLQQANKVSNLRIALLNSQLAEEPKALAVSVFDDSRQTGVIILQNMKPLEANRDYQLWVVDPQYEHPVDGGVFQVDAKGNARIEFKVKKSVTTAKAFAVTREVKGGVDVSKGPMILVGG